MNRLLALEGREATADDLASALVVVTDEVDAIGALHVYRDLGRWSARMSSLIVAPESRGQGLAKAVVRKRLELAAAYGPMRVLASHNASRPASGHILESQGMRRLDGEQTFYGYDVP